MPTKTNKKKEILIISQYFPPDISGGGTRAYNYAKCLADNFDVTVITAFPHLHNKVPSEYRWKIIQEDKNFDFRVIRVRVPSLLHSSTTNRIILHISFLINSLIPISAIKPDVIFASEPNLLSIIPAYIYSKLRGGKIIRIVDDLWPEVLYERKIITNKLLKRILDRFARFSYSIPIIILPLTEEAVNHIHKLYKINKNKILVIHHGVNTNIFKPIIRKEENKEFVVMYSGAIVESYDFDVIINAAKLLRNEKIKFIIRGKGSSLEYIKNEKSRYNLDNLFIDDKIVSEEKLIENLNEADVFLVPMKNDKFLNMSLPTKILEYQALAKPVICCSNGAPGNHIEKTHSGIRVDCGDFKKVAEAIIKLKEEPVTKKRYGEEGKLYVDTKISFEKISEQFNRLIHQVIE